MRQNRLKSLLQGGRSVFGTFVSLPEPGIVEVAGHAGFDFVIIDMEHSPISLNILPYLLAAADCTDIVPLVRVGTCAANPILRVLDSGALGVMAAHVCGADDALALVQACRYPPQGVRGVNSSMRATGYGHMPFADHIQLSNSDVLTVALIEDKAGVKAIEEIAATPGLDVIVPGPGDLSASLGVPGQPQHPEVQEAVSWVAQVVGDHPAITLGFHIMDPAHIDRCRELGARFIIYSQDSRMLLNAFGTVLIQMKQ